MKITQNIIDDKLLRKLERIAKQQGKTVEQVWDELSVRATRIAVGIDTDLSPGEAAAQLGVHINTVMNYVKAGKFKHAYHRSARAVRIPISDVEALKDRRVNNTTH